MTNCKSSSRASSSGFERSATLVWRALFACLLPYRFASPCLAPLGKAPGARLAASYSGGIALLLASAFALPQSVRSVRKAYRGEPDFSEEAWSDDMPSELKVQDLKEGQEMKGVVVRVVEEWGSAETPFARDAFP